MPAVTGVDVGELLKFIEAHKSDLVDGWARVRLVNERYDALVVRGPEPPSS